MGKTYIGVGDTAQQSKKIYLGVNDVAKKVKKAYVGVNGVAQEVFYAGGVPSTFTQNQSLSDVMTYSYPTAHSKVAQYALFATSSNIGSNLSDVNADISVVDSDTLITTHLESPLAGKHYLTQCASLPDYAVFRCSNSTYASEAIYNSKYSYHVYDKNLVHQSVYYGSELTHYSEYRDFNNSIVSSRNGNVLTLTNNLLVQLTSGLNYYSGSTIASNTDYAVFITSNASISSHTSAMSKDGVITILTTNAGVNTTIEVPVNTSNQAIFVCNYAIENSADYDKQRTIINAYSRNLTETTTDYLLYTEYYESAYGDDKGFIFGCPNSYRMYCVDDTLTLSDTNQSLPWYVGSFSNTSGEVVGEKLLIAHLNKKFNVYS